MSGSPIRLQNFDDVKEPAKAPPKLTTRETSAEDTALALAKARGAARAEGFADGVAEAEARIEQELHSHLQTLAAAIEAATARSEERQRETAAFVRSLVSSLLRRVAPHLAAAELPHEVARFLSDIIADAPAEGLVVDIAAQQHQALSDLLEAQGIHCQLRPVEDLSTISARVHWHGGFDQIDMNETIEAVRKLVVDRLGDDAMQMP